MITPPTPPTTTNHLFEATKVRFNGFTGLSEEQDKAHISIEFTSLCHSWCLVLYPGGQSTAKEGMVSLFLQNQTCRSKNIEIEFGLRVKQHKASDYHVLVLPWAGASKEY
jgi:hypothetical protein